jgi:hypothetical protein
MLIPTTPKPRCSNSSKLLAKLTSCPLQYGHQSSAHLRAPVEEPCDYLSGGRFPDPPIVPDVSVPEKIEGFFLATEEWEGQLIVCAVENQGFLRVLFPPDDQPVSTVSRSTIPVGVEHTSG